MLAIAVPFVEICLLRRAPQDLPASPLLLGIAVTAHVGLGVLVTALHYPLLTAIGVSLTGTLLLALLAFGLLSARGFGRRFTQTFAAFAGTGAVLQVIAFPLVALLEGADPGGASAAAGVILTIPWLALLVWSWVVSGHILRHALSVHLTAGIGISMAFFWLSALVIHQLFGNP